MKKIIFILGIFLVACSKDKENAPTDPNTYQATVKENFTDPFKRMENIQVNDFIPYTLTIEESGDSENVEYRLISIRESQDYHQTIWKDFGLYLKKDDNAPFDREKKYISFSKKGNYNFYIRPFVPGTFKLTFELQKYVNNKPIGTPTKLNVIFNAVKITIDYEKKLKMFGDEFYYSYYIILNDGDEKGDTYLDAQNMIQKCTITYNMFGGEEKTAPKNRTILPHQIFEYVTTPNLENISIKKIRITQTTLNLPEFVIEYYIQ